jgi:hypothetical protein
MREEDLIHWDTQDPSQPWQPARALERMEVGKNDLLFDDLTKTSALELELLTEARITIVSHAKYIARMLGWKSFGGGSAIVFPFFEPGALHPYGYRFKPLKPRQRKNGDKVKYEQPADTGIFVYFTPRASADGSYMNAELPLVWLEGEKKALGAEQAGFIPIGLTGVSNWHDKPAKDAHEGTKLHALILKHCAIAGRKHVICFDADARSKPQVMDAAQKLAGALLAAGASEVLFCCPPSMEAKGLDDYLAAHGIDAVRALIESAGPIEVIEPKKATLRVRDCFDSACPLRPSLLVPEGYSFNRNMLCKLEMSKGEDGWEEVEEPFFPSCIVITRRFMDLETRVQSVEVTFRDPDGTWCSCILARATLRERALLSALSAFGADFDGMAFADLTKWLALFERFNASALKREWLAERAGWFELNGEWHFVCGSDLRFESCSDVIHRSETHERAFAALGMREGASLAKHTAALERAWQASDDCALMIAAALSAPLLKILGSRNFALHLCGDTSRGKTSMLQIAASIFGDPRSQQWVAPWLGTLAATELRAQFYCDLPLCFDESGTVEPEFIARAVYMLANGEGRPRATKELHMRPTAQWRTVVLSTGEVELANEDAMGGQQVRVISVPITGFGALDAAGVDGLREACAEHAGAVGELWLRALAGCDEEDREAKRAQYRTLLAELRAIAGGNSTLARTAMSFAVMALAAEGARCELGFGSGQTIIEIFRKRCAASGGVRPMHERLVEALSEWVTSNPRTFPITTKHLNGTRTAAVQDAPMINGFRLEDSGDVAFVGRKLREELERCHIPWTPAVMAQLIELGRLRRDERQVTKRVRINGERAHFYVFQLRDAGPASLWLGLASNSVNPSESDEDSSN